MSRPHGGTGSARSQLRSVTWPQTTWVANSGDARQQDAGHHKTVVEACRGKAFLNFDDEAFGPVLHRYLAEQFPASSCYERPDNGADAAGWIAYVGVPST